MTSPTAITCSRCGAIAPRTGATQQYCRPCSHARDLERKRLWKTHHPPGAVQRAREAGLAEHRYEMTRAAGLMTNEQVKRGVCDPTPDPELLWYGRVAVPFSYAASKNHIYTMTRRGHVSLRREVRAKRAAISTAVRRMLRGQRVAHNKVWIDLFVQKPDHKGDAINVVDMVCDAIKDAIPVDDRWFCIRRLDWEIAKHNPQMFIGIGQDTAADCQVCSHCGRVQPFEAFGKRQANRLGIARVCKQCLAAGRALARATRGRT